MAPDRVAEYIEAVQRVAGFDGVGFEQREDATHFVRERAVELVEQDGRGAERRGFLYQASGGVSPLLIREATNTS